MALRAAKRLPWFKVLALAQILLLAQRHVQLLEPRDRRRFAELAGRALRERRLKERDRDELASLLAFVLGLLRDFGLDDYYLELSTRGESDKFIGSDEEWATATAVLEEAARGQLTITSLAEESRPPAATGDHPH